MTPAQLEEARRWTALRGWRWMPGMLATRVRDCYFDPPEAGPRVGRQYRVVRATSQVIHCCRKGPHSGASDNYMPDLSDPATRGCCYELARQITGWADLSVSRHMTPDGWSWCAMTVHVGGGPVAKGEAETLALLAACEAHERLTVTT